MFMFQPLAWKRRQQLSKTSISRMNLNTTDTKCSEASPRSISSVSNLQISVLKRFKNGNINFKFKHSKFYRIRYICHFSNLPIFEQKKKSQPRAQTVTTWAPMCWITIVMVIGSIRPTARPRSTPASTTPVGRRSERVTRCVGTLKRQTRRPGRE